jgi:glycerol kinase
VVLVPAFTGLGAPWWDAEARGAIFGLTRDSGRPEIAAAAFDAAALQTRDLIEAMRADAPDAFGPASELRIDGGMSRSPWFSQRLADLTGLPVARSSIRNHGPGRGPVRGAGGRGLSRYRNRCGGEAGSRPFHVNHADEDPRGRLRPVAGCCRKSEKVMAF